MQFDEMTKKPKGRFNLIFQLLTPRGIKLLPEALNPDIAIMKFTK